MKKLISAALGAAAVTAVVIAPSAHADTYNTDTVNQFIATVNIESDRYGTGHVPVYVDYLGDNKVIAQTNGVRITLNATWAELTPNQFNALIAEDIANGFTPGGCAGIQATAIHEMGHIVDRQSGRVASRAVSDAAFSGRIGSLHSYAYESGSINPGEAVAISFQAVECGSATPTERAIYNVLTS